jgi:hypothetical protein
LFTTACAPQPVLTNAIPVFAHYTPEEQRAMGRAFDDLPSDSPLRPVIRDCKALRDEVRKSH